jgi:hypothetical protein
LIDRINAPGGKRGAANNSAQRRDGKVPFDDQPVG